MKGRLAILLQLLALSSACTMAPKYARPQLPVPDAWPEASSAQPGGAETTGPAALPWKRYFTDPHLQSVIELALVNNRDLRTAALNVDRARALYGIQRSELFPNRGVVAQGEKYRLPERMTATGTSEIVEQYSVNAGVSAWELDLFGRVRSLRRRALHQYFATDQARAAAQLSLVAAVAQSYLSLAADREGLHLAQATLEAQSESFDLIRQSREMGMASDLELEQARSQVEASRADTARFEGLVALDRNALDLLVGRPVPEALLPDDLSAVVDLEELPAGLPSEVLLLRPDILASEYQLKAANANIGAARAAFFPRITLTGAIGTLSPELSGLFESGTRTWSFTPQVTAPLFTGGQRLANLRLSKVDKNIAVAQYEKSIQTAFREVADALALRTTLREQESAQQSLAQALQVTYQLSEARYKEGLDGYLGVLVAQRSYYGAQQALVATKLARQANQISLFKALGGGA